MRGDVLIVSAAETGAAALAQVLRAEGAEGALSVSSGGAARRLRGTRAFSLCVINAPLPDETGEELALEMAKDGATQPILLVRAEAQEDTDARLGAEGVVTLARPLSPRAFRAAVRLIAASRARVESLERENEKLRAKLEETRLACRAKCMLVEKMRVTEEEAHRILEKQAMDARITRREAALRVIRAFD